MLGPTSERIGKMEETHTEEDSLNYVDELSRKSVPDVDKKKDYTHIYRGQSKI